MVLYRFLSAPLQFESGRSCSTPTSSCCLAWVLHENGQGFVVPKVFPLCSYSWWSAWVPLRSMKITLQYDGCLCSACTGCTVLLLPPCSRLDSGSLSLRQTR
ncbi:hypothetical protein GOP47_0010054 [Adiantum capillus-veneris]|uniref:Uncharacterized protein n=1 Tax=Adiantum capillus-veneris TaxID=13818 RepID=A0A9D4ZFZ6_ADICA|nr:hypothetical protein GOP47_0010054 [Adiantum capillus-veneris]